MGRSGPGSPWPGKTRTQPPISSCLMPIRAVAIFAFACSPARLPTAYCLLPTAYCLLPAAGCRMPAAGCRMPAAGCRMPAAGCRMPAACCRMPDACCRMPDAYCLLPTAYCLLPAACCLLPAACCLLPDAWLNTASCLRSSTHWCESDRQRRRKCESAALHRSGPASDCLPETAAHAHSSARIA